MLYKLIRTSDGKVLGQELAGDWKHAIYKLSHDASEYIKREHPDRMFAGMRALKKGEKEYFHIQDEKGRKLGVFIGNIRKSAPTAPRNYAIKKDGPITRKQAAFLRRHGHDIPVGATKKWASAVISDIIGG